MTSKYRGKDKETGEWVYGWYLEIGGKPYIRTFPKKKDGVSWDHFIEPASVGQCAGPPENDLVFYDGDIIEFILAFGTSQTHTGDNIPGGSYTEPDEPFIYQVRGQIYYDEERAMWECTRITKEYGVSQEPHWLNLDSDYISIVNREEYCLEYIKSLCCEDCETCKEKCWILEQTKSKDWDELERKMNAMWVIGNKTDNPELLEV